MSPFTGVEMNSRSNLPMIIRSLQEHWPSRTIEWIMSGFMISWGLYVLFHPELFRRLEVFAEMGRMVWVLSDRPAVVWGSSAFVAGVIRATALFVNGAYTRTPVIRVITSFVSMFILTQIIIGLYRVGIPNTGLPTYTWLLIADMISAYRAARDAVHAETERRRTRRVDSSHRSLRASA